MRQSRGSHDLSSRTQIGRVYQLLHDEAYVATGVGDWHSLVEVAGVVGAKTRTMFVQCPNCGMGHAVEVPTDFYTARNRVSELKKHGHGVGGFTIRSRPPREDEHGNTNRYRMERLNVDARGVCVLSVFGVER